MTKPPWTIDEQRQHYLAELRAAFDKKLITEVHKHSGIPHLTDEEMVLREAIAELLAFEERASI